MNEQPTTPNNDDVEGHGFRGNVTADTDDVEGHAYRPGRDALGGHRPTHPKADDADDVSGHLSGALGSIKKTEDGS